jgi:hypothetical protein
MLLQIVKPRCKKLPQVIQERLEAFCSNPYFENLSTKHGEMLLWARANLIASGDAPLFWTNRTPFSAEIAVLDYMLTREIFGAEPAGKEIACRELLRAMKETNCATDFKEIYPLCYSVLEECAGGGPDQGQEVSTKRRNDTVSASDRDAVTIGQ